MARAPRLDLPGIPQHVVQRGNDRQACFADSQDHANYRDTLGELAAEYGVAIHAYVLMGNHVHLLATPLAKGSIPATMQALGARYVRYFNTRHGRSGTLWEGRFRNCLVDSDTYLWNCHRYNEMNPVRAGLAGDPRQYAWSSFAGNALGRPDPMLTPHPLYLALGVDRASRCSNYHGFFDTANDERDIEQIRSHLQQQKALGSESFQALIEAESGRCARVRPAHRPARVAAPSSSGAHADSVANNVL